MKESETISGFASKLSSIRAKFRNLGTTLESKIIVRKLLNSVPKKFLPIVATIEQYQDLDEMSFEEAVGRLTAFEERIKSQDTLEANDQDKLLLASSNNQSHGKGRGKNFNNEAKESTKWKNSPNARGTRPIDNNRGQMSFYIKDWNLSLPVGGVASGQSLYISDMARGNMSSGDMHSFSRDQSAPSWNALNKLDSSQMMIGNNNVQEFMGDEFGSQNSIPEGKSSHEVGGMVIVQPLSISDMARNNMSSGGIHPFSRDQSAPSWNALNKLDSSQIMIDSDNVQ
ncbi:hypothetical protein Tco_0901797 [Tanacetum coccineum]